MRRLLVLLIGLWAVPSWALTVTGMTPSTYTVATLTTGSIYYVDRTYTLTSIPASIGPGATWIKTANNDKTQTAAVWLTFSVDQAVLVSVAYSAGATVLPGWLVGWTNTGEIVQTTDVSLRVYQRAWPPGPITLGGNLAAPAAGSTEHYVVAIRAGSPPTWPTPTIGASFLREAGLILQWQDQAINEAGTRIERRLATGSYAPLVDLSVPDVVTFTDGTVTAGVTYCYRVLAYNAAGLSGYSNEACAVAH